MDNTSQNNNIEKGYRCYHVYQHCAGLDSIFLNSYVTKQFMTLLRNKLRDRGLILWNYVFMPEHYHLLLWGKCTEKECWIIIAEVLREVNISFSKTNKQLKFNGKIFSTRPQYIAVTNRHQLLETMWYIFSNPKKDWPWREYWKSAAWEYERKTRKLACQDDLEVIMGITVQEMMAIVDREDAEAHMKMAALCKNDTELDAKIFQDPHAANIIKAS